MKNYKLKFLFLTFTTCALLLPFLPILNTYAFGGGDGSSDDPYLIESCGDLEDVNEDLDANYKLTTDLVCTSSNLPLAREMDEASLAGDFTGFTGVFDGDDNTISFAINVPDGVNDSNYLGLFGYLNGAIVKDLNLIAGYQQGDGDSNALIGGEYVGSLAGTIESSQVINVHATNAVITDSGSVGGLTGSLIQSRILGSSFTGNIFADGSQVGGLAGSASIDYDFELPAIERSYAVGDIEAIGNVGGLVGHSSILTILDSYSAMNITDTALFISNFGGLAGYASAVSIERSYSTGFIFGNDNVGGIVGLTSTSAVSLTDVFSTANVSGVDTVGAVIGENSTVLSFENSYFDSLRAGVNVCLGSGDPQADCTEVDTTFEAAEYWKYNAPTDEWNTDTIWNLDNESDFPNLRAYVSFDTGDGSAESPYELNDCEDLTKIDSYLGEYFILNTDLDCSEEGTEIIIGSESSPFTGNFDGQSNSIIVDIDNAGEDYSGLFANVEDATIENLTITGSITGDEYTGGLAGYVADSTIYNIHTNVEVDGIESVGGIIGQIDDAIIYDSIAIGSVIGSDAVGGLIGTTDDGVTISQSAAKGNVTALNNVAGGLVGFSAITTIKNSYAHGDVSGNSNVGGLIGETVSTDVIHSYSAGTVTAASNFGGFIGVVGFSNITDSYFDSDRANTESPCSEESGDGCEELAIYSRQTSDMQNIDNYYESGDYGIDLDDGQASYRYVRWQISNIRGTGGFCDDGCTQVAEFELYNRDFPIELPVTTTVTNPDGDNPIGEGINNLIDGNRASKFLDQNFTNSNSSEGLTTVILDAGEGELFTFDGYNWVTGNDQPDRDPIAWIIAGSNDGENYFELDAVSFADITNDRGSVVNPENTSWDFRNIWSINPIDNDAYPFLRHESEFTLADENTELEGDDECTGPIDLGFDFEYFGETYDSIYFSTNGILDFDNCEDEYDNNEAPLDNSGDDRPPDFALLPFWDDLESDFENSYYRTTGPTGEKIFIAQWTLQYHHTSEEDDLEDEIPIGTIQVYLYEETGEIKFQYLNLKNGELGLGNSATIGLTGDLELDEPQYTSYSHLEASLTSNMAILFTPDGPSNYEFDDEAEFSDIFLADELVPEAPSLIAPEDDASDVSLSPEFTWSEAEGANYYRFFLATTSDFDNGYRVRANGNIDEITEGTYSSVIYSDANVETNSLNFAEEFEEPILRNGQTYYWYVIAVNEFGEESIALAESTVAGFQTAAPEAFTGGGTGTEEDPYTISNCDELADVKNHLANEENYFRLMEDIDCTELGNDVVIGDTYLPFSGNFDGNNHAITIDINTNNFDSKAGLFGQILDAEIYDLTINGNIIAGNFAGGLTGFATDSIIANVISNVDVANHEDYIGDGNVSNHGSLIGIAYNTSISESEATGDVIGANNDLGGLVGEMTLGEISNSSASGRVGGEEELASDRTIGGLIGGANSVEINTASATGAVYGANDLGGLIGYAEDVTVENSFATGDIIDTAPSDEDNRGEMGGFIGQLENSALISQSYATGSVSGSDDIGGFIGHINSESDLIIDVNNCYARGDVEATNLETGNAGGFVGRTASSNSEDQIENSYSTGLVTGGDIGGFIGVIENEITVFNSVWDTESSEIETSEAGTGKTTEEMQTETTFTIDLAEPGWDFDDVWGLTSSVNDHYPYLLWQYTIDTTVINAELSGDDSCVNAIDIGFDFEYYGQTFDNIDISTNGTASFDDDIESCHDEYDNEDGPLDGSGQEEPEPNTIFAFWDDLETESENILYQRYGVIGERRLVIQWTVHYHHDTEFENINYDVPIGTFQIILDESDQSIKYQYNTLLKGALGRGGSATIGLTGPLDDDDTLYEIYSHNEQTLESGDVVHYQPDGDNNYELNEASEFEDIYLADDRMPSNFDLTSPADEVTDIEIAPTFTWDDVAGAESYKFFLARSDDFDTGIHFPTADVDDMLDGINTKMVLIETEVEDNSLDFSELDEEYLTYDQDYYWFVVANNINEEDDEESGFRMSPIYSFTTTTAETEPETTITSCEELTEVNFDLDNEYTLVDDLECSELGNNIMIGSPYNPFTGIFHGNGHTITVNIESNEYTGLFRRTEFADIEDLTIAGTITGTKRVGGLIGQAYETELDSIINSSDISANNPEESEGVDDIVGGLVGEGYDIEIELSSNTGSVETVFGDAGGLVGTSYYSQISTSNNLGSITGLGEEASAIGGLIGSSYGVEMDTSYTTADISGFNNVGGLIGYVDNQTTISRSYAAGNINGNADVGGLVGDNGYGLWLENSYFRGNVQADAGGAAGLIGDSEQNLTIINNYFTGTVSAGDRTAPIVNYNNDEELGDANLTNSGNFWNTDTAGEFGEVYGSGETTAELKQIATFTTELGEDSWDFAEIWLIDNNGINNDGFPYLSWQEYEDAPEEEEEEEEVTPEPTAGAGGGGGSARSAIIRNQNQKQSGSNAAESINKNLSYNEEVKLVLTKEIITKDPEKPTNKCEALVIMARVFAWEINKTVKTDNFSDTPDWCKPYADFAKKNGIVEGRATGELGMQTPLTRDEIAVMLIREFERLEIKLDKKTTIAFKDDQTDWAKTAIQKLAEAGIIKGFADGKFGGRLNILKQDLAIMVNRASSK
jgi:hypothetical protein